MKRGLCVCAGVGMAALAASALAGPLDKRIVPAEATSVAHIDVEALAASAVGRLIAHTPNAQNAGLEAAASPLDRLRRRYGLDPLTDVRSLTIYSTGGCPESAVIVADMINSGAERVTSSLAEQGESVGYEAVQDPAGVIHSIAGPRGRVYLREMEGREGARLLVAATSPEHLESAAALIGGSGPNLTEAEGLLGGAVPAGGSLLFVAATEAACLWDGDGAGGGPASSILGRATELMFDMGERDGVVFAEARIWTEELKDAHSMVNLAGGMMAMIGARGEANRALMGGLRARVESGVVRVEYSMDSEEFVRHVKVLRGD